ncbi:hypothetical protein QL285_024521 [Trifolium repens]|nr:hypothetical protein QL285_024521 [Trifolium repens]
MEIFEIWYFCYGWQCLGPVIQCMTRSLVEDVCMIFEFQDPPFCGCLILRYWTVSNAWTLIHVAPMEMILLFMGLFWLQCMDLDSCCTNGNDSVIF